MDKKKSFLNVVVSISFKVVLLVFSILVRRLLIKYLGMDIAGLNTLFLNIIGFLSITELGIGTAISFSMYRPIVEGDHYRVAALYNLFKKIYLVIGAIILVGGLVVMPFLPYLAADYASLNVNVFLTFFLMLISTVLTYAYSAKISLINAYKNNYITTTINSISMIVQYIMQIVFVLTTKSFVWYLVSKSIGSIIQWVLISIYTRKHHFEEIHTKNVVTNEDKKIISKNVRAMFLHKIGGVLINTSDSIIISSFIGLVVLGQYSNYVLIMSAMTGIISLFFIPLTSVIGHLFVKNSENQTETMRYFRFFYTFNYIIAVIFFLGYFSIIDDLLTIFFSTSDIEPVLSKSITFVIVLNYFIQFMKETVILFRDASGTFYVDRWKSLIEGIINVVLSILFVLILPENLKVVGVIIATIITNLFIDHIIEPFVLYKYAFKSKDAKKYWLKNYLLILLFSLVLLSDRYLLLSFNNNWISVLVNGTIAVCLAIIPSAIAVIFDKDFRFFAKKILKKGWIKK